MLHFYVSAGSDGAVTSSNALMLPLGHLFSEKAFSAEALQMDAEWLRNKAPAGA
jgi:hypothetical protein